MFSNRTSLPVFILHFFLLTVAWAESGPASIKALAKEKIKVQREVRRNFQLPITASYLVGNYAIRNAVIKAYPLCFFTGDPKLLSENLDVSKHLILDTMSCYASVYINSKLTLVTTATKHTGDTYSFYPVNPPVSERSKGIGSRSSDDVDIKLVQAAAPYSETAFFFQFYPGEFKAPDIIGFYEGDKVCFIDENKVIYKSFGAIIKARYGSLENFREIVAQEKEAGEERLRKGIIKIR